jgi:hypothetical protein
LEEIDNQQETSQIDIRDLTPAKGFSPTTSTAARIPLIQSPTKKTISHKTLKDFAL